MRIDIPKRLKNEAKKVPRREKNSDARRTPRSSKLRVWTMFDEVPVKTSVKTTAGNINVQTIAARRYERVRESAYPITSRA
jgi:hypothetical protein